jgi:hypothetical protein
MAPAEPGPGFAAPGLPDETTASEAEAGAGDAPADPGEAASGPQVELSGILATPGESPLFTLDVYYPDGLDQRVSLGLGSPVWGDWVIEEYNPDERTVTLNKDGRFLILRRGSAVTLTP